MISSASPILATDDVAATIAHYEQVLGFGASWTYGEPAAFGAVTSGNVTIMFSLQPELATRIAGQEIWLNVDDADELYARHTARGARIHSPIESKPWGFREYTVQDPNGYLLRFAQELGRGASTSTPLPEEVRIVRRLPTAEEESAIKGREFPADYLDATWQGVVAVDPEGEAVGAVRIMRDAPGWFSIWDVDVRPEWQGRHIGQAMMKEALAIVREESPGAFVFLFTTKGGFYERLGFAEEKVHMRRV